MKRNLFKILLAYTAMFACGIIDNLRGPAYPAIVEHFRVTQSQGSLFFALASFSSIPVIALGRLWLKRLGTARAQTLFILPVAVSCIGIWASFYFGQGFALLLASSVLFGIGTGASSITTNAIIARVDNPGKKRRLFSGLHSMYGIASVSGPAVYGMAVSAGGDWNTLFLYAAAAPLAVFLLGMFAARGKDEVKAVEKRPLVLSFGKKLKVGLTLSLYVSAEIAVSSRLVLFAMDELDINGADASSYLSFFFLMLLAGRLLFFAFQFPWRSERIMLASAFASAVLCAAGVFIHPAFFALSGLSMSIYFPCGMDWLSKNFGVHTEHLLTFSMTVIAVSLIFMHWGVGILTDLVGIKYALLVCPALLAGSITMLTVKKSTC